MITFSLSSLIMAILFSNILIIFLSLILKNKKLTLNIGYKLLFVFFIVVALRLLFPFELFFSTNILLPDFISRVIIYLKTPLLSSGPKISIWTFFLAIWLGGIIIQCYRFRKRQLLFTKTIKMLEKDITNDEPFASILNQICQERKRKNIFQVLELSMIESPMITGIRKPRILIPKHLKLNADDWYYIFMHETAHHFHHDLLIKYFSQLLCAVYWWNPFVYLLKKQFSNILEMQTDASITTGTCAQDKYKYMECLLSVAKNEASCPNDSSISFCSKNQLRQRFELIADSRSPKKNLQALLASFMICFTFFSMFFILEPYHVTEDVQNNSFEISDSNAYLIRNEDNSYDLYKDGTYVASILQLDETLSHLPIYKNLEEIIHD